MDIILFLKKYKLNNNNLNNIKIYLEKYLIMSDFMKKLYGLNTFDTSNKLI